MSERRVGTISRGIRCPIIREGDDLVSIVSDSVLEAAKAEGFEMRDRDVISITESIVARAQGNYATVDDIAADVKGKVGRRDDRSNIPDPFKKPFCDMSSRNRKGRKESRPDAELSVRRGGQ